MSNQTDYMTRIVRLCTAANDYSPRMQEIHEAAMRALGMCDEERMKRHKRAAYFAQVRIELRRKKKAERQGRRVMA